MITIAILFVYDGYVKVAEYGLCVIENPMHVTIFIYALLIFTESLLTISLNIWLVIKAYQKHKQIQQETRLSVTNNQVKTLKHQQRKLKKNRKPIIALLVIVHSWKVSDRSFNLLQNS